MNKIPENILNLMLSDAYVNSNNPEHQNVAKQIQNYFKNKYSNSTIDATGRNITIRKAWCWHATIDERTCEDCASFSDTIYENEEDIPEHPHHDNCRCWIEEIELDDGNNIISSRMYKRNANDMKLSDKGINMLKKLEGSVTKDGRHVIYDDKTGKPVNINEPLPKGATIGYGHLIKPGENFRNGITESVATELLRSDIAVAEHAVQNNIDVMLSQNQYDALVSLAYNIGSKNFTDSTVVKYINNPGFKDTTYPTLESAWKTWNKSGGHVMTGLSNRRNQEWNMFNN